MVDPLAIANCALNVEVSDESRTRNRSGTIGVNEARGTSAQNVTAPSAMTETMYQRAPAGWSRSKLSQVYFFPHERCAWKARASAEVRTTGTDRRAHAARRRRRRSPAHRRGSRMGGRAFVRARCGTRARAASRARGRRARAYRRSPIAHRRESRRADAAARRHDGAGERDARVSLPRAGPGDERSGARRQRSARETGPRRGRAARPRPAARPAAALAPRPDAQVSYPRDHRGGAGGSAPQNISQEITNYSLEIDRIGRLRYKWENACSEHLRCLVRPAYSDRAQVRGGLRQHAGHRPRLRLLGGSRHDHGSRSPESGAVDQMSESGLARARGPAYSLYAMKRTHAACVLAAALAAGCESSSTPSEPSATAPAAGANATASIAAPRPLSPANNVLVRNAEQPVTLTVLNAITTASSAITYTFEVASDAAFANRVQTFDNVAEGGGGQTTRRLDLLAPSRDYWWHVRASGGGTTGVFGPVFKFSVGAAVTLGTPTPIAPLTGQTTSPRPGFRVANVSRTGPAGPITYRFEVANSSAFTTLLATGNVAEGTNETVFVPTADLPLDVVLFWRVTATDALNAVSSATSAAQSFTPHIVSQAERVAQQLGVPLWPGQLPPGTPGHAVMGDFWTVEVLTSYNGVRFQNPPIDALRVFDLIDRDFDPQAAIDWMNSHGYPTGAAYYPSVRVIGFDYEYMAYVGAQWSLVLRVGA